MLNKLTKNIYENNSWQEKKYVCGLDEVGRGCLAGPVVTAACILQINSNSKLLKDSKLLSKKQREKAFIWIKKHAYFSIGISDHKKIDQLNIYQSTKITMEKSLLQLLNIIPFNINKIKYILSDAMPLDKNILIQNENIEFQHFPKGEKYSATIAAASIVAKVFRDNLMQKIDTIFPSYNFKKNKGYGTNDHLEALKQSGPTIIHRKTFLNKIPTKTKRIENQINLF